MKPQQFTGAMVLSILITTASMSMATTTASAKDTIIGVALFTRALSPTSPPNDFNVFFDEAAQVGSQVTWIFQWGSLPS